MAGVVSLVTVPVGGVPGVAGAMPSMGATGVLPDSAPVLESIAETLPLTPLVRPPGKLLAGMLH